MSRADDRVRARCFHPSGAFIEFSKDEIEQTIPERFEKIAAQFPDRTAAESKRHRLTYRELSRLSNSTAQAVLDTCGNDSGGVAVLMEHDVPVVGAILGAFKAGKFYVPLDPSLPLRRSKLILADVRAETIVTNTRHLPTAKSLAGGALRIVNLDEIAAREAREFSARARPDDLCWVIYTSGSTGRPKGVMQTHRNVLHFMRSYTNALRIGSEDRLSLLYSFSVNGGAHDIFAALLNGATICPYDLREEGFAQLGPWLNEASITIYHSVPTVFRQFLSGPRPATAFPTIRIVRLGGEPVYRRDWNLFKANFSEECILVNRLGSSETGSLRMYFMDKSSELDGDLVPVGYAVEDNDIHLVDDRGEPAAGPEGEIAVTTRYVSPGYWGRPELTAASFVPDPVDQDLKTYRTADIGRLLPDGCLMHLGRKDFFVKIRGYRVEPAEIETALMEFPGIKEAVVAVSGNNTGEERLTAYIVRHEGNGANVTDLRSFLRARLPEYMIPAQFMFLERLPLTDTLKVDRKALPQPTSARPNICAIYSPPRNEVESSVVRIWEEVLGLAPVGIHDDFLDLGGHSIAATRIVARVAALFSLNLPLHVFFEASTVAQMAAVIEASADGQV